MFFPLIQYERKLWDKGLNLVAGVDEAGRGPLAGPLVTAAVILDRTHFDTPRFNDVTGEKTDRDEQRESDYLKINDSKLLTPKRREELFKFISENAVEYSIVAIEPADIDQWGIMQSTFISFSNSVKALKIRVDHILSDFYPVKGFSQRKQTNIRGGDKCSISVAAASILAKVYRDNLMKKYHEDFPNYGFDRHKGYGTKQHLEALNTYGPCQIHRRSFKPVKLLVT